MPHRRNKLISLTLCLLLLLEQTGFAQTVSLNLSNYLSQAPKPAISDTFRPLHLRYLSYDNSSNNFQLLLDKGSSPPDSKPLPAGQAGALEQVTQELLQYFFIGLILPNDKFWVNLRPDSPDDILDPDLEKTDIGRIFLEADVQLKQDTSGLTSPQTKEGKEYWDKLYKKAGELFGSENITIPTLTRPWIVPDEVILRESPEGAYIYKATLKVMLEEDYLSRGGSRTAPTYQQYTFSDPRLKELNQYSTQLIKETIIPKLTQAVNTSRRYAPLRQVYYSLILAQWFKQSHQVKRSQSHQLPENPYIKLIDSGKLITPNFSLLAQQPYDKQAYFKQYQQSFQDGEYNLQEPIHTPMGQSIRRYMSGGMMFGKEVSSAIESGKIAATIKHFFGKAFLPFFMVATVSLNAAFGEVIRLHYDGEQGTEKSIPLSAGTRAEINVLKNELLSPDSRSLYAEDSKNNRKSMLNKLMGKISNDKERIEFLKVIRNHSDLKSEAMALLHKSLKNLREQGIHSSLPDAEIELGLMDIEKEVNELNKSIATLDDDQRVDFLSSLKGEELGREGLINQDTINEWLAGSGEEIHRYQERGPGTGGGTKDMQDSLLALLLAGRSQEGEVNTNEARESLQELTKVWKSIVESGVSPDENPDNWLANLKKKGIEATNPAEISMQNYLMFFLQLKMGLDVEMPSFGELLISAALNMDLEQRKKYLAYLVSGGDASAEEDMVKRLANMTVSKEKLWKDFSTALLLKLDKIVKGKIGLRNVLEVFINDEFEEAVKGVLKEIDGEDSGGQLFGIASAVDWNLRNYSIKANDENIAKTLELTVKALKSALADSEIFSENTFQAILVYAAGDKNMNNRSEIFKWSAVRSGVPEVIPMENYLGLKSRLRIILTDESTINKGERVLVFNMHGQSEILGNRDVKPGEGLTTSDMVDILDEYDNAGGDLSKMTLVVRSCYSQDYVENMLTGLSERLQARGRQPVLPKRVFFFSDRGSEIQGEEMDMRFYVDKKGNITTQTIYEAQKTKKLHYIKPSGMFNNLEVSEALSALGGNDAVIPKMVRGFIGSDNLYGEKANRTIEMIRNNKILLNSTHKEKIVEILKTIEDKTGKIGQEKIKTKLLAELKRLRDHLDDDVIVTFSPKIGIVSEGEYVLGAVYDNTIALIDGFFNYPVLRDNNDYLAEMLFHEMLAKCFPEKSHSDHKARYLLKSVLVDKKLPKDSTISEQEITYDVAGIQRDLFGKENKLGKVLREYIETQLRSASSAAESAQDRMKAVIRKIHPFIKGAGSFNDWQKGDDPFIISRGTIIKRAEVMLGERGKKTSLHLGSGGSVLPIVDALLGFSVIVTDLNMTAMRDVITIADKLQQEIKDAGGEIIFRELDLLKLIGEAKYLIAPEQEEFVKEILSKNSVGHVTMTNVFNWAGDILSRHKERICIAILSLLKKSGGTFTISSDMVIGQENFFDELIGVGNEYVEIELGGGTVVPYSFILYNLQENRYLAIRGDDNTTNSSSAASDDKGGIDLSRINKSMRAESVSSSAFSGGNSPVDVDFNVNEELIQLQKLLNAQIIPSADRLNRYARAVRASFASSMDSADSALSLVAETFRLQEEKAVSAPTELKTLAAWLE